jgi:hypothetical protein
MAFVVVVSGLDVWVAVLSAGMPLGLDKSGYIMSDRMLKNSSKSLKSVPPYGCFWSRGLLLR